MVTKKQKISHAVIFLLIILGLICSVNYYVDSYAQIRISYREIAQKMADGKNVVGFTENRGNERYLAYATIEAMDEPLECIMIGSSLSMTYGKEVKGEEAFYNFSLSGGSLTDYYGLIGYLAEKELLPKKVILEIGGPLFYDKVNEERAIYLQDGMDYLMGLIDGTETECVKPKVGRQYYKLLSLDYFKYNAQCIIEKARFAVEYTTETEHQSYNTKLTDGSIVYSKDYRARTNEYVENAAKEAIANNSLYKIGGYDQMSAERITDFEKLVEWLISQGVEVQFFLPPYYELIYNHILENDKEYGGVLETEKYTLQFAEEKGIKVYGSYSPEESALTASDFMDAYHLRRESIHKAFFQR